MKEGITVLDADYEELELRVEHLDLKSNLAKSAETSGYLALLASTHHRTLDPLDAPDTLWIGGIPEQLVGGSDEEAVAAVRELCDRFGEVLATTVRKKPGENKSWALVTFEAADSVEMAVLAGLFAKASDGTDVELRVAPADVEAELQKGTTGYLAHTVTRHEKEVANARKLLRGWWDRAAKAGQGLPSAAAVGGRRFSIEKRLQRFRALSLTPTDRTE